MYMLRVMCTMVEHFRQYKKDHFNTIIFPTQTWHGTKMIKYSVQLYRMASNRQQVYATIVIDNKNWFVILTIRR